MIRPDGDDYYATTDVYRRGPLDWVWEANLRQPWPSMRLVLAEDAGSCSTEKRAKRKADRVARRMMRAADSWARREYGRSDEDVTA
ncbi:MAG: hypothetical protein HOY79_04240 [Streptomyces sp.]|nr:hypothetical protein [Streptomyces sp.]NUS15415.1 hypothetical protein [Streptomyces sp.]NUS24003.1 hypothetical protein [Streptomyces sp.]